MILEKMTTPENSTPLLIPNKKSFLYRPFDFIHKEYGNDPDMLIKRISGILTSGLAIGFIKNKKLKLFIRAIQYIITTIMLGIDFYAHIKHYIKESNDIKDDPYKKRMKKVSILLGLENTEIEPPNQSFDMSPSVAIWFTQNPKTSNIIIKGYYNLNKMETLDTSIIEFEQKSIEIGILFTFNNNTYLWDLELSTFRNFTTVSNSYLLGEGLQQPKIISDIRSHILRDFVRTFDISKNILKFDKWGCIISSPRRHIQEILNQFDVKTFIKEIIWVLKHKTKRTYAFVGKQGVGKSLLLRLIESTLTQYMIIHLTPEDLIYSSLIEERFATCKMLQPLIIIIEDLDACNLKEKNEKVGTFLNCIDEVNKDLNMVIIYTVNDTSLIHRTIINRPGRSDKVIEILSPQNETEVLEVILNRLNIATKKYEKDFTITNLNDTTCLNEPSKKCLKENFTQAEIANAVVEQALIEYGLSSNEKGREISLSNFSPYIYKAIESQLKTRKAIQNCNFHNEDPDDNKDKEIYDERDEDELSYKNIIQKKSEFVKEEIYC